MFWLVSGLIGLAMVFVKLGAYSVWMTIFKGIFTFLTIVTGIALVMYLVRRMFS